MIIEKKGVDYNVYVYRQGRKIHSQRERFFSTIPQRIRKFERIFNRVKDHLRPGKVLCLGARTGCEVKGARRVGFADSIGIDLHPAKSGGVVLKGDWHDIPFPKNSFENVFTNSIDHCFDLVKLIHEVHRVLKPGGCLFLMLSGKQLLSTKKDKKEYMLGSQNFLFWDTEKDLIQMFEKFGFELIRNWQMGRNWHNVIMKKV